MSLVQKTNELWNSARNVSELTKLLRLKEKKWLTWFKLRNVLKSITKFKVRNIGSKKFKIFRDKMGLFSKKVSLDDFVEAIEAIVFNDEFIAAQEAFLDEHCEVCKLVKK